MDSDKISALAREYAEEQIKDTAVEELPAAFKESVIIRNANSMEKHLHWLVRRFCLVEKEAISHEETEKAADEYAGKLRITHAIPGILVPFIHDIARNSYINGMINALGKKETQYAVIDGWVARDSDGDLSLFLGNKPYRDDVDEFWSIVFGNSPVSLPKNLFPDITWDDTEPTPVEQIVIRKNVIIKGK